MASGVRVATGVHLKTVRRLSVSLRPAVPKYSGYRVRWEPHRTGRSGGRRHASHRGRRRGGDGQRPAETRGEVEGRQRTERRAVGVRQRAGRREQEPRRKRAVNGGQRQAGTAAQTACSAIERGRWAALPTHRDGAQGRRQYRADPSGESRDAAPRQESRAPATGAACCDGRSFL